ncbi:hypothetical protein J2S74_000720 [Evansella vedderi]|uniref:Peptidase M28 n=1 Tax=Evansella vedderi TaxID=38282 RepID=A0ABT9ZQ28_9BACI|nr:M20/M25/M40 family metallo-hydrolase [Evansella vedderi]MDQ0253348.1 hypothetical protein [Evansella vedderi]
MKTWAQLFVRHGFKLEEQDAGVFDCRKETERNMTFLLECLEKGQANVNYVASLQELTITSEPLMEEKWISILNFKWRGRGEGLYFSAETEEPAICELDTFIAGIVRQLNRLGLHTNGSCDGHGRNAASISMLREDEVEVTTKILLAAGVKKVVTRGKNIRLLVSKREQLLDVAETLSVIQKDWLGEDVSYIRQQFFYQSLEELLSIDGCSGEEGAVREYILSKLHGLVDHVSVDHNGNVLSQKTYGSGTGPTLLLNAHMDTVDCFAPGRVIVKKGAEWSSSEGILGADDRAGVAVVLAMADWLEGTRFNGKVKYIFTVEEEVGLVGASGVHNYFLWDVDAAIVVDRRGTGDIVVSCGGYLPFCHEKYGEFLESVAVLKGLEGWKTTAGGSSDTRVWAEHGIQSVNLSVGYQGEHTDREILDVEACYKTLKLVQGVFQESRELQRVLRRIKMLETMKRRGTRLVDKEIK